MSNELVLSEDITVITAEINAYQRMAGEAIYEIGRRLHEVKYNPSKFGLPEGTDKDNNAIVARGYWGEWLESVSMSYQQSDRFIRVFSELGNNNYLTYSNKGLDALYHIATIDEEEREKHHTVPSSGETKTVDEMTVRELMRNPHNMQETFEALPISLSKTISAKSLNE